MHRAISFLFIAVALTLAALLISGQRVLVFEHIAKPGETYVVQEHGDLGDNKQASLHCRYFTGRSFVDTVYWYAPNNMWGKDSCPFTASQATDSTAKSFVSILGIFVQVIGAALLLHQSYRTKRQLANFKAELTYDKFNETLTQLASEVGGQFYQQRQGFIFLVIGSALQAYSSL